MADTRKCRHCGTSFAPVGDEEFCCTGCAHVHRLIEEGGLDRFYSLRDQEIEPVSPSAGNPADFGWLESLAETAEKECTTGNARLSLDIKGISCVGCVWLLEELFRRRSGAVRIDIRPQTGTVSMEWIPGAFSPVGYASEIRRFGYRIAPPSTGTRGDTGPLLTRMGVCAFLALNTMLFTLPGYLGMAENFRFADTFELLALLFSTLSFGVGGLWFVGRAWDAARMGVLHIDLPIAIGVTAAWLGSVVGWLLGYDPLVYFDFVAIFLFLMLAGRWLQERSVERNRARVRALDPSRSLYRMAGEQTEKPVAALQKDDRYRVPPGGTVPVLSVLESTDASISLESINGEPDPVAVRRMARIPSGATLVSSKEITVRAEERWDESLLHRLVTEDAGAGRNPLLEKVLAVYTAVIIGCALIGGTAWTVFGGAFQGLQVAVSILVVSCPCSLGIAWPLINDLAAATLRRRGLYLQHVEFWGRLPAVRDIVFDKTGTLTLEIPKIANPEVFDSLDRKQSEFLLALVQSSFHPFGRALRGDLLARITRPARLESFEEIPGQGVSGKVGDECWSLGKAGWRDKEDPETGGTVFAHDGQVLARFHFRDDVRDGAAAELAELSRRGYGLAILSGDRKSRVTEMARILGIPEERALGELDPPAKAAWIQKNAPGRALMIGDGANDALAFAKAVCRGSPLIDKGILESRSDFFFTGRDLSALRVLFSVAAVRTRRLRQVFCFAVLYNASAVGVCLAGLMNPLLAAILMPASALATLAIASRTRLPKA